MRELSVNDCVPNWVAARPIGVAFKDVLPAVSVAGSNLFEDGGQKPETDGQQHVAN
jgi:hypothetical protein